MGSATMTASPTIFFLLVFALSVPFYLLGATGARLFDLAILPASSLMVLIPMVSALVLVYRQRGIDGIVAPLKRALELSRHRGAGWYLTALFFMPAVCVLEFGIIRLTGVAVPLPTIVPSEALFLYFVFFIGAIGEEAGWQGYAYPALRNRLSAWRAAVVLGAVWGLWHVIPFVQQGRSVDWILWQCLSAVAMRIIIVWLYENTGNSLVTSVLFHTMFNVSWALFPNAGSYYDPFVTFVILIFAVGLIFAIWQPSNMARRRRRRCDASDSQPSKGTPYV
jgi:membrane protease YdiL (CAAX protease family)